MYDMIIKGASVLDGTGAEAYVSDVAIRDGKIARIASGLADGKTVIDAKGLVLTPGWIDSHSHSDRTIMTFPDQREKAEQGITFSIGGNCGGSVAPSKNTSIVGKFDRMHEFFAQNENFPQGSGAAVMVGFNAIRGYVVGNENRAATPEEVEQMKELARESMKAGAIGMSFGLFYVPGCYATKEEAAEVAKVIGEYGGVLSAHIRDESDHLLDSVEEFLYIIRESGCRGVFSHHKVVYRENWGKTKESIAMIDRANEEGADVYLDVYPYTATCTSVLARYVPSFLHPPGTKSVFDLLGNPESREKIKAWGREQWGDDLSWTLLVEVPGHPEYEGKTVNELAEMRGQQDRYDALFDLACEVRKRINGCFFTLSEEDVERAIRHPRAMIGSDGAAADSARYHPRLRGTFPRVLGRYVRERGIVSLPEMIRKMTSLPAAVYNLPGKGKIAEGYDADLCIFDPEKIIDRADYVRCNLPNEGLNYVIIDGKVVVENNTYNGIRAGKIYRREN